MARINIDDSLFYDPKFINLITKTGSQFTAIGAYFYALKIAETYLSADNPDGKIPLEEWREYEFGDLMLDVKLARILNDKVIVFGAEEQFGWLQKRRSAGSQGGKSRTRRVDSVPENKQQIVDNQVNSVENDSSKHQANSSKTKQNEANSSKRKPLSLSLSLRDTSYLSPLTPQTGRTRSDAERFEQRFKNSNDPNREKYLEVLSAFVAKNPVLRTFLTARRIDEAMLAYRSPEGFYDFLESTAKTMLAKGRGNPIAYFKAAWRNDVLDRISDLELSPAPEGAQ